MLNRIRVVGNIKTGMVIVRSVAAGRQGLDNRGRWRDAQRVFVDGAFWRILRARTPALEGTYADV